MAAGAAPEQFIGILKECDASGNVSESLIGIASIGDLAVKDGHDALTGETLEKVSEGVNRH